MRKSNLLIVCLFLFTLIGCRSSKPVSSGSKEFLSVSDSKLMELAENVYLDYNNLYIKKYNAVVIINNSRKTFSGSMFLQKDSQLVITVAPLLGIELFRAKFDKDTVFLLDRTKKDIYKGSYKLIENLLYLQLNFNIVESIFSNRMFIVNSVGENHSINKFKHSVIDNHYVFTNTRSGWFGGGGLRNSSLIQAFYIEPVTFKLGQSVVSDSKSNYGVEVFYSDMRSLGNSLFPHSINIKGHNGTQKFEATFTFPSIEVNSKNSLRMNIPDNYSVKEIK